jgi:small subunit ribosomal protein S16
MLKIRLRKPGKSIKRRYHYKIVVTEAKFARDSKFVKQLGYYNPTRKLLKIDIDKYQEWIKKGAQPTQTVASLFKRYKKQVAASK